MKILFLKIKGNFKFIVIFLIGLMIASYPLISQYYYRYEAESAILIFEKDKQALDDKEIENRIRLAKAYNRTLDPNRITDPYSEEEKEGIENYAKMLEINEKIGYIDIPKINEKIPIYAGTKDTVLKKGAGHLEGTSLPIGGESTHTVITAHRGLPEAKLFTNLDKLTYEDIFYIHNVKEVLAYKVDQIKVVNPNEFEEVLVIENEDYATLLTCTPYMINTHRLLVRGYRVPYEEKIYPNEEILDIRLIEYLVTIAVIFIILLIMSKRRKAGKKNE